MTCTSFCEKWSTMWTFSHFDFTCTECIQRWQDSIFNYDTTQPINCIMFDDCCNLHMIPQPPINHFKVTMLSIINTNFNIEGANKIANTFPDIEVLCIEHLTTDSTSLTILLKHSPTLTTLSLINVTISDTIDMSSFGTFTQTLTDCKTLYFVELEHIILNPDATANLLSCLHDSHVTCLRFSNMTISFPSFTWPRLISLRIISDDPVDLSFVYNMSALEDLAIDVPDFDFSWFINWPHDKKCNLYKMVVHIHRQNMPIPYNPRELRSAMLFHAPYMIINIEGRRTKTISISERTFFTAKALTSLLSAQAYKRLGRKSAWRRVPQHLTRYLNEFVKTTCRSSC